MRDGVNLSATVYRDPKQTQPLPVILTLTPYIAEHAAKQGLYFAQNGYVFVAVDLRGRGNSGGTFHPGQVEAKDGYDTVEWAAIQPWCNGQVAMWGGSWLGFTQWSIAKEFPPHLHAIAPTAAVYPGVDFPQHLGVFGGYALRWLTYVHGQALNSGLFYSENLWTNAYWQQIQEGRPFQDLENLTGALGTDFKTWLSHPTEDAFWRAMTPNSDHFAKLAIPVLTITGHFDADQLGALTYYDRHLAVASRLAAERHFLVIGPWDHGGTRRPEAEMGGLSFGKEAVVNMEELHKAWYDHVLKGGRRPDFLKDRVACFVMGLNSWIYSPDLKHLEGNPLSLHLELQGAVAGNVLQSGRLQKDEGAAPGQVTLLSDPKLLPDRADVERENPDYLKSQRREFRNTSQTVVLHSPPFPDDSIFSGRAGLKIQLACDQPDADLWAFLSEILPDGGSNYLSRTRIRLRYRKPGKSILMEPGRSELVEFPNFEFFARKLAKGSRLRLVLTSEAPFGAQRNTQTGGDLVTEPLSHARPAKITLSTGPGSGSQLDLSRPDPSLFKTAILPIKAN